MSIFTKVLSGVISMPPILARKLRFSDVVYAIGGTPKSLRNWLQRNQVALAFSGHHDGWHEFSIGDIAVLVLVRRMVDFGVTVEKASDIANCLLQQHAHLLLSYKNAPPSALAAAFVRKNLIVSRDRDEWAWFVDTTLDQPALPPTFIFIDLHAVLATAFERASDTNPDRADQAVGEEQE